MEALVRDSITILAFCSFMFEMLWMPVSDFVGTSKYFHVH